MEQEAQALMVTTSADGSGTADEESMGASLPFGTKNPGLSPGGRPSSAHILAIASSLSRAEADVFVSTPLPSALAMGSLYSEAMPLPEPLPSSPAASFHVQPDATLPPPLSPAELDYVPDSSMHVNDAAYTVQLPYHRGVDPSCSFRVDASLAVASSPFWAAQGECGRNASLAFHVLVAITLMLGSSGQLPSLLPAHAVVCSDSLGQSIATRFHVRFLCQRASILERWGFISALAASSHARFVFHRSFERHYGAGDPVFCDAHVLSGAIAWLRRSGSVERPLTLMSGDWPMGDIFHCWPPACAIELASFAWPIDSIGEFKRLLRCQTACPVAIMGCEFTAAVREAYSRAHGRVAISVDTRSSLVPGPHSVLDLTEVLMLKVWLDAYLFPPCTHQVLSDTRSAGAKRLDGRTFWGIAFFLFCWSVAAHRVRVEQPNTIIPEFIFQPSQRLRPCDAGDSDSKPINLYERGWLPLELLAEPVEAQSGHRSLREFENAEARDRWRSSWARFPRLCALVVALTQVQLAADAAWHWCWRHAGGAGTPCSEHDQDAVWGVAPRADVAPNFITLMETFAVAWYRAGYPVPSDYLNGKPSSTSDEQRAYQARRGAGDGRRVVGVVPVSLRSSLVVGEAASSEARFAILDGTLIEPPIANLMPHGLTRSGLVCLPSWTCYAPAALHVLHEARRLCACAMALRQTGLAAHGLAADFTRLDGSALARQPPAKRASSPAALLHPP